MSENEVVVYISNDSSDCNQIVNKLSEWNVDFQTKNISEHHEYLEELQDKGVYGTPATIVGEEMILGSQINKLKNSLGMDYTHYSSSSFHGHYNN